MDVPRRYREDASGGFPRYRQHRYARSGGQCDEARKIYAVQFHPEVHHSVDGDTMLRNFLFKIAKITPDWTMSSFVERVINEVRETVGDGHVVCALSGGVDSTVVAVLLHKAIGKNLHCIFVDNGVLRSGEGDEVVTYLREHFDLNLKLVNAQDRSLICSPGSKTLRRSARSSAIPSSTSSMKRRAPSATWNGWLRGPSIPT